MAQDPYHRRRAVVHRALQELLPDDEDYKYEVAHSGFEAGIQAESFHPDTIIVDLAMGRSEALQIAQNLRRNAQYETDLIIALASEDEANPEGLTQYGYSERSRNRSTSPFSANASYARRGETRQHVIRPPAASAGRVSAPECRGTRPSRPLASFPVFRFFSLSSPTNRARPIVVDSWGVRRLTVRIAPCYGNVSSFSHEPFGEHCGDVSSANPLHSATSPSTGGRF